MSNQQNLAITGHYTREKLFFFGIFVYTLLLILIFYYSYKLPDDNMCTNINTYKFIK